MKHRSRPDLPPQWWSSPHLLPLRAKSQPAELPVIPDPRLSLSSPPESPSPTSPIPTFTGKGPTRAHPKQPPSHELQEVEDEEYAAKPYNPYNLPPASVIAVEVGSQSQSQNSPSRISERNGLDNPVIPALEDFDVTESQATTISTFFSPDLDARLPKTPDSDDNAGGRGRPVAQKRIASRGGGGAIRSTPRTTRVSPMTTPTNSRFSKDARDRESREPSFACAGAKAVTSNSKRRNLASLLGIRSKGTNKSAPKAAPKNDGNTMDLDVGVGLGFNPKKLKGSAWVETISDIGSWDEHFFAAGGGRENCGSGEGDNNGQWTEYLQTVGDAMTIASMDFVKPRAAPLPPNPSLPTIPTIPSLSPLPFDDAVQDASVVTSTPRTKERAKTRAKRTGRFMSTGFPSPPMEIHTVPTTTFGLGLEGIEMELALAMDTDFMDMDVDNEQEVNADSDVDMDQATDATPTLTTKTTVTNGKTKNKSQSFYTAADVQRQQQPTPAESIIRLPLTSLKTPFNGSSRFPHSASNNLSGTTMTKPLPLPQTRQLLLTRTLTPRTPLSGSKPPAQKLMGKTMISLPSVSTTVTRPTQWNDPSPATPTQQPLSPLSPSPTPSPQQTPCPPERPVPGKKPVRPVVAAERTRKMVERGEKRAVEKPAPMTKNVPVYEKRVDSMDEVRVCAQIDECINATDRMEEVHVVLTITMGFFLIPPYFRLCAPAAISTLRHSRLFVTC